MGARKCRCAAAFAIAVFPALAVGRTESATSLATHPMSASLAGMGGILTALIQPSSPKGGPIGILKSLAQSLHARLCELLAFSLTNLQSLQETLAQQSVLPVALGLRSDNGGCNSGSFD